jgi:hypothetical protein
MIGTYAFLEQLRNAARLMEINNYSVVEAYNAG